MIDITFKEDYTETSIPKNVKLSIGGVEYGNESIVQESMKLSGILMPDLQLKFGGCNAKQFSLSMISDSASDLVGQNMVVSIESPNGTLQIGKFTITSFNRGNKNSKVIDLTAIDDMAKTNVDVTDWYNALTFPMTIKALRDSLFVYLGIPQETVSLPLDAILIQKGYGNTSINANAILRDICDVNGRFGDINNQGIFVYRKLKLSADSIDITGDEYSTLVKEIAYEDYVTQKIDSLIIKRDGVSYGYREGNNTYVVNGSLFNGLANAELDVICPLIFNEIKDIAYTPTKITMRGLPYLELGDRLKYKGVEFYLFTREMVGIQALNDMVTSEGAEYLTTDLNSVQEQIANLRNADEGIKRTIEETAEGIKTTVYQTISDTSNNLINNSRFLLGFIVSQPIRDTNGDYILDTNNKQIYDVSKGE